MVKIEAVSLEVAYAEAANKLTCSVTELQVEIIQYPAKGFFGLFKKQAVIVASSKKNGQVKTIVVEETIELTEQAPAQAVETRTSSRNSETIMPQSFVTVQDEENEPESAPKTERYVPDSSAVEESLFEEKLSAESVVDEVRAQINTLFACSCFAINDVAVSFYDENTLLIEFTGDDAALLIGKEGYRYKALSYMLFNWINSVYQMQIRLEIAEFLKNQEESVSRYLIGVYENIEREGRAQTKILDGVLLQIALRELRDRYPDRYVAIRSTRDGSKFIIINDYNQY